MGREMTTTARLADLVPASADPDDVFEAFLDWTDRIGLNPYPAQQDALIEIVSG